jgi:hypothetical protein
MFRQRWSHIGGYFLASRGILPNYTDKQKALDYWANHKKYREFRGSPRMMEIFDQKFMDLIRNGTVEETTFNRLVWLNPCHLVPKNNADMRLVVDTTKINKFMKSIHFKMEGVPTLKTLLEYQDYAITFDLKEAYNHVPVHPSMRPLLGVAWRGRCYRFKGMPFGLNDAPRVFTQLMKKAVREIREVWNIKAIIYLDDLLLLHPDPDHLLQIGKEVTKYLK